MQFTRLGHKYKGPWDRPRPRLPTSLICTLAYCSGQIDRQQDQTKSSYQGLINMLCRTLHWQTDIILGNSFGLTNQYEMSAGLLHKVRTAELQVVASFETANYWRATPIIKFRFCARYTMKNLVARISFSFIAFMTAFHKGKSFHRGFGPHSRPPIHQSIY